jgi:hypothetical protein
VEFSPLVVIIFIYTAKMVNYTLHTNLPAVEHLHQFNHYLWNISSLQEVAVVVVGEAAVEQEDYWSGL